MSQNGEAMEEGVRRASCVVRRTFAEVRVDAHVARRARQALVLPVRDVLVRLGVDVLLREPEVDDVDLVRALVRLAPDQEVLRLHVAVDQVLRVDVLHARDLRQTLAVKPPRSSAQRRAYRDRGIATGIGPAWTFSAQSTHWDASVTLAVRCQSVRFIRRANFS